ncbi:hypothetical protein D3C86_2216350 [compost metagenome]
MAEVGAEGWQLSGDDWTDGELKRWFKRLIEIIQLGVMPPAAFQCLFEFIAIGVFDKQLHVTEGFTR